MQRHAHRKSSLQTRQASLFEQQQTNDWEGCRAASPDLAGGDISVSGLSLHPSCWQRPVSPLVDPASHVVRDVRPPVRPHDGIGDEQQGLQRRVAGLTGRRCAQRDQRHVLRTFQVGPLWIMQISVCSSRCGRKPWCPIIHEAPRCSFQASCAASYMHSSLAETREQFLELSGDLARPCSLFDSTDVDVVKVI